MIEFFLHRELTRRNIRKTQFAKMIGVRPDTITAMYNGDIKRVHIDVLDKICYALGCELSDIMSFTDKEYVVVKRNGCPLYGPETRVSCEQYLKNLDDESVNGIRIKQVFH